jgi:hypothetical protein
MWTLFLHASHKFCSVERLFTCKGLVNRDVLGWLLLYCFCQVKTMLELPTARTICWPYVPLGLSKRGWTAHYFQGYTFWPQNAAFSKSVPSTSFP